MDVQEELENNHSESDWTDMELSSSSSISESSSDRPYYDYGVDSDEEWNQTSATKRAARDKLHHILPIGVGSILWDHFGLPSYTDGAIWNKNFVNCFHCNKALHFGPKVLSKMRTHLQQCKEDVFEKMLEQEQQTPYKELPRIPSVVLGINDGEHVSQKRHRKESPEPDSIEERNSKMEDALFKMAVTCLDFKAASVNSPFVPLFQGHFKADHQGLTGHSTLIQHKYQQYKDQLVAALKKCYIYSMSIEEWKDKKNKKFLTYSVNHMTGKGLQKSVVLTRPKNLDELPGVFETMSKIFSVDQTKVVAVVSNSDIDFAQYWNAEAKTQFFPCFLETLNVTIRKSLLQLPSVKDLLRHLRCDPDYFEDIRSLLAGLSSCFGRASHSGLTESELQLMKNLKSLLAPLRLALATMRYEEPVALASTMWPIIYTLQTKYLKIDPTQDDEHLIEMKKAVSDFITQAYSPVQQFLQIATLLDPRFRLLNLVVDNAACKEEVLSHMETIIRKNSAVGLDPMKLAKDELDSFETDQPVDYMISPLSWWDTSEALKYSTVREVAWKFNCVPLSCLPTERLQTFDKEHEEKRARLPSDGMDMMLFLEGNVNF